jgi:hypothetical protein
MQKNAPSQFYLYRMLEIQSYPSRNEFMVFTDLLRFVKIRYSFYIYLHIIRPFPSEEHIVKVAK